MYICVCVDFIFRTLKHTLNIILTRICIILMLITGTSGIIDIMEVVSSKGL